MTTQTKAQHTPGRDERGNYWFDCGCMVNGIMQQRCHLHVAAPALLKTAEAVVNWYEGRTHNDAATRTALYEQARAAIRQAKGE